MRVLKHATGWLLSAAVVMTCQTLVLFALNPGLVEAAFILVAALFAWFLLRGSRLAWGLVLLGVADQLVSSGLSLEHPWELVVDGIVVVCLLVPSSVRFIWTQPPKRQSRKRWLKTGKAITRVRALVSRMFLRLAGWNDAKSEMGSFSRQRSYGTLILRLGMACVSLFLLAAMAYEWQHDSGHGAAVANIAATVSWDIYVVVQLGFIVVVGIALYRHFSNSRAPSGPSRS